MDKSRLMRQLHALAKKEWGLDNPHILLHQLAVSEFNVKSLAHCSAKELVLLADKITEKKIEWKKVEDMGVTRIPEMSGPQQAIVINIQKELGWSDEYIFKLTVNRYGYLDWKYLTGREAFGFVSYLIRRKHQQKKGVAA